MKTKQTKSLLKFLAVPALFGAVVASAYGITSSTSTPTTNQKSLINHVDSVANANQPTIDDVVNGDVSSLSQPITTTEGNYILPTLNTISIPGILKANSFVSELYGINFTNFKNYHVRQIVPNYNDQTQFFVLLVNDAAEVPIILDSSKITFGQIINPGHVLAVKDTGSSFSVTADYQLDVPILDKLMMSYYRGLMFQQPLGSNQEQIYMPGANVSTPWNNLKPNYLGLASSLSGSAQSTLGNITYNATTSLKKLNETWLHYDQTPTAFATNGTPTNWPAFSQNVGTILYLNSMNNMVFVSREIDRTHHEDAIYLFGGNQQVNLWFYTFKVNEANASSPIVEPATSYANYRIDFTNAVGSFDKNNPTLPLDISKAYSGNYQFNSQGVLWGQGRTSNPYPFASFFGWYVAGAKYVNKSSPQIELSLSMPNFARLSPGGVAVFSTNANIVAGSNAWSQPTQSRVLDLFGSIPIDVAFQTVTDRDLQVATYNSTNTWSSTMTWEPRYNNTNYNFVTVLSSDNGQLNYDVTNSDNDGYRSQLFNKVVTYWPETIGNDNVILKYTRNKIAAVVMGSDGRSQTTYEINLNLRKSNTDMHNLTNISFNNGTWFLSYKQPGSAKSIVYSFAYNAALQQINFTQTNLTLDGNLDVLNVLPLNSDYIYVLAKDATQNKVIPLLYRLSIPGNYQQNLAFNNLMLSNQVTKLDGIPSYAEANGTQNADQKAVWGTVSFKDIDYVRGAGFLYQPASVLADDTAAFNTLVDYQPGWNGQDIKVTATVNDQNQLAIQVSIKYLNGLYYTPQELSAQNALNQVYAGFNAQAPWVLPVAIAVPICTLAVLSALGLGLGIPMLKTRKLQDKGFAHTYKKVDTLTAAVGSVYKKIALETEAKKKRQKMLKAAKSKKSVKKPVAPTKPITAATSPITKPVVPPVKKPTIDSVLKPTRPIKPQTPKVAQ